MSSDPLPVQTTTTAAAEKQQRRRETTQCPHRNNSIPPSEEYFLTPPTTIPAAHGQAGKVGGDGNHRAGEISRMEDAEIEDEKQEESSESEDMKESSESEEEEKEDNDGVQMGGQLPQASNGPAECIEALPSLKQSSWISKSSPTGHLL
jgi:hypothetical protein